MTQPQKPIFSNLIEQDSGYVTAGNLIQSVSNTSLSEEDLKTDLYRPQRNNVMIRNLVEHAVDEYNKSQPRIQLAMYRVSGGGGEKGVEGVLLTERSYECEKNKVMQGLDKSAMLKK